jgi:predicted DNA binding CopG/RHH family protein
MLANMEQPANPSKSAPAPDFAGFLASLTAPKKADPGRDSNWNDGAFGDDVVTLSYDQALRNHARYRVDERDRRLSPAETERQARTAEPAPASETRRQIQTQRELRTASVTIRLSAAEWARLHQRATEAGLTVSAYLRSCVLEADALRQQVKEALAEMKTTAVTDSEGSPARGPWLRWMACLKKRKGR